jgi:hypothetical protein
MRKQRSYNRDLAAAVLLAAIYTSDENACQKYNITPRTLYNYRKRLEDDSKLSEIFQRKKAEFDAAWANDLPGALRESIEFIKETARRAKSDPHTYRNPALIHAIAGAMKMCAEVHYTGKWIDARLDPEDRQTDSLPGPVASQEASGY